ncbi:MAG: acyl carrier protein [Actinomycetales bacterium]|nr:MAG: acyl carrier protein [Actinomycetales bacterium]
MAHTPAQIRATLADLIGEETGIEPSQVELGSDFVADLGVDSLSMMTIIVNAEERFAVRIPNDMARSMRTVRDVVDYIAAQQSPDTP